MLNFAEQTGSGAVMIVWSFLLVVALVPLINGATLGHKQALSFNGHYKIGLVRSTYLSASPLHCLEQVKVGALQPKPSNQFIWEGGNFWPCSNHEPESHTSMLEVACES